MLVLAATTLEKIQNVPAGVWLKIFAGFIVLLVGIFVIKLIFSKVNKYLIWLIVGIVLVITWLTQLGEQNIFDKWSTPEKSDPAGAKPGPKK